MVGISYPLKSQKTIIIGGCYMAYASVKCKQFKFLEFISLNYFLNKYANRCQCSGSKNKKQTTPIVSIYIGMLFFFLANFSFQL